LKRLLNFTVYIKQIYFLIETKIEIGC